MINANEITVRTPKLRNTSFYVLGGEVAQDLPYVRASVLSRNISMMELVHEQSRSDDPDSATREVLEREINVAIERLLEGIVEVFDEGVFLVRQQRERAEVTGLLTITANGYSITIGAAEMGLEILVETEVYAPERQQNIESVAVHQDGGISVSIREDSDE